ncbi:MAG: hypothetical protein ACKOB3_02655, partial [Holophagaceae bacterium]
TKKGKRKKISGAVTIESDGSVETQLLTDMAATISDEDKLSIRQQCQFLLNKVCNNKEKVLPLEEVVKIVQEWQPQREILCLYLRIARKLPGDFHLDSISTLLCISKLCGFNPVGFLKKTKSLVIKPASTGRYGSTYTFNTVSTKRTDKETINRKFVGLSLTLSLLEHSVANSCGVISRNGMRSSTTREPIKKLINLGDAGDASPSPPNKNFIFETMPTHEFHKRASLIHRLWLSINHRWMSFHLVKSLFETKEDCALGVIDDDSMLVYSFMMHSGYGKSRFDFLDPMVGICFRFTSIADIEANRTRLNQLWLNPSNFVRFGNNCLQRDSYERKVSILVDTFQELHSFPRILPYNGKSTDESRRWLMLRGYIFFYWLKRESCNGIRLEVESRLKVTLRTTSVVAASSHERRNVTNDPREKVLDVHKKPLLEVRHSLDRSNASTNVYDEQRLWYGDTVEVIPTDHATESSSRHATESPPPAACVDKDVQANLGVLVDAALRTSNGGVGSESSVVDMKATRIQLLTKDWSSLKLLSQKELDQVFASYLLIHTDLSGMDILLQLSPLEVYSADKLKDFLHCRLCGGTGYRPVEELSDVVLHVGTGIDQYLDQHSRLLHVARQGSGYFKEYQKILPSDRLVVNLCQAILTYGKIDHHRSNGQYRVNIGCGGQHFPNGIPAELIGKGFGEKLDADHDFDTKEILSSIGMMVEFLWRVAQDMQRDTNDAPLGMDHSRQEAYARHLREYLFVEYEEVGFEDITLVLYPICITGAAEIVSEHKDKMNDDLAGYSRTCVFSSCFSLNPDVFIMVQVIGNKLAGTSRTCLFSLHFSLNSHVFILLQVIGNFRKVVRQRMVPFHNAIKSTTVNAKRYIQSWQSNMQSIYTGLGTNEAWNPFDRTNIFLDDNLPFKRLQISKTSGTFLLPEVNGEYLLTEIGLSRVTLFSMFIDPITALKETLCTDQLIELIFFASLLSNPFWFHHVMAKFNRLSSFAFGTHPFYDVVGELYQTFGTWQGGPYNRWSPCGGPVPVVELFGAHPTATASETERGKQRLEAIVGVLFGHMEWINSLKDTPLSDLPLAVIRHQWEAVRKQVHDIVPCQFSLFRISVFTTIVSGCNQLEPGPHLKQLTIPMPGGASYKHLQSPSKGFIPMQSARDLANNKMESIIEANQDDQVNESDHDRLMIYLSNSLGRKTYVRDEMECLLCESHPARKLERRDWFCKGQNIFDIRDDGIVMFRPYGRNTEWKPVGPRDGWTFLFLNKMVPRKLFTTQHQNVLYFRDDDLGHHALAFGSELRQSLEKIIFNGRRGQGTENYDNPFERNKKNGLIVHHYRSANMFSKEASMVKSTSSASSDLESNKMRVLGNGDTPKKLYTETNTFESFVSGKSLLRKLSQMSDLDGANINPVKLGAGCVHLEVSDDRKEDRPRKTRYFPGHLDKCYMDCVQFLPLSGRDFFTFLAVPTAWKIEQDRSSIEAYRKWLTTLTETESESVEEYRDQFQLDACRFMKMESVISLLFWNELGSMLQFPSNQCFHATVIPAPRNETEEPLHRDLLILHPLLIAA